MIAVLRQKKIAKARKLYEAESIYRAATVIGLMEDDNRTDMLIKYDIPDRETRISEGYATVINKIEKIIVNIIDLQHLS